LVLGVYLGLILNEGDDTVAEVAPWMVAIAVACAAAVVGSSVGSGASGQRLLRVAAGMFFVLGLLSLFSIGLPLVVAGVLCLATSERLRAA
jgi:hypothetical protein